MPEGQINIIFALFRACKSARIKKENLIVFLQAA